MGSDSHQDSRHETADKVLPAVQHSVESLSVRQSHAFWIASVARALAVIVLLIGTFVFAAGFLDGAYQTAVAKLSDMGQGPAAGFLIGGLALYLQCLESGKLRRIGALVCAGLLLLLGAVNLLLSWGAAYPISGLEFPYYVHPASAIAFILAALTLALHDRRIQGDRYPAEYLASSSSIWLHCWATLIGLIP